MTDPTVEEVSARILKSVEVLRSYGPRYLEILSSHTTPSVGKALASHSDEVKNLAVSILKNAKELDKLTTLPKDADDEVKSAAEKRVTRDLAQSIFSESLWKYKAHKRSASVRNYFKNEMEQAFPVLSKRTRLQDSKQDEGTASLESLCKLYKDKNYAFKEDLFQDKRLKTLRCEWTADTSERIETSFEFRRTGEQFEARNELKPKFQRIRLGRIVVNPIREGESVSSETNQYIHKLKLYRDIETKALRKYRSNMSSEGGSVEEAVQHTLEWLMHERSLWLE
mmetsp:Transcript_1751/g.2076  ORF Transcript_1751/g.2076 Transcript_1751/m.2076 type:complete len:282 (-) Transcript_1751:337-1182(-)